MKAKQIITEAELPAEELAEIWRDDKDGEYVQINDDGSAYYVAHGRAMEQIAPPVSQQTQRVFRGGDPRRQDAMSDAPVDTVENTFRLIRQWMEAKQFWPNVWSVNDHGNIELYTANGKPLGGLV